MKDWKLWILWVVMGIIGIYAFFFSPYFVKMDWSIFWKWNFKVHWVVICFSICFWAFALWDMSGHLEAWLKRRNRLKSHNEG